MARDRSGLEQTAEMVKADGQSCLVIEADLSTTAGAQTAGRTALSSVEHWDILVNNAGVATSQPLLEADPEVWDRTLAVNLRSALVLAQMLVPAMLERRAGKVINVSSIGSFLGTPGLGAYAASKAALNQLTRTMAVEWGPFNVQVNAVCPTVILTDMGHKVWNDPARADERREKEGRIPAGRFGEPQDVAGAVAFLAGPDSDFINGATIPIDGGLLVVP